MPELPTLERFLVLTALVILFAGTPPSPTPKPIIFHVGGRSFSFAERNVSALAHCPKRFGYLPDVVGLALLDPNGKTIWSINVMDALAEMRRELTKLGKCLAQVAHARIEGVAIAEGEAHFVVSILACGASCAGRDVEAFRFDGQRVRRTLDGKVYLAEVRFKFPTLTLYAAEAVNCNACPRRWTRTVYQWRHGAYQLVAKDVYPRLVERNPWSE